MKKIGFIGFGNMASAIAQGIINAKFLDASDIIAYDISSSQKELMYKLNITSANNEKEVIDNSEYVVIAVKPQVLKTLIYSLKDYLKNKAVISIVLGYNFETYASLLDNSTRIQFVMPNTPVLVGEGMCLFEDQTNLKDEELKFVKEMFGSIGDIETLPSHLMKVGGALSGSAPAYIYMVIEALADGAVEQGMPRTMAYHIASQMVMGSGKMQRDTKIHPGILKDNVCSPGGSTIRGVKALEDNNIRSAFIEAIDKSTNLD